MKMLKKLARSLATRYVCQNCEKEKERRAVAHNATNSTWRRLEVQKRNEMAYCKCQLGQGQPGHAPNADCQGLPAE